MTPGAQSRSVFAPVTALAFNASQFDDLKTFLEKRTEHTDTVVISDVEQLLMAADGRLLENGYRFNILGFASFCNGVAQGLASVFNDVAGTSNRVKSPDIQIDMPAAVSVYNTIVRSRIDSLRERTLLVNHQERVVEGFLGLNHRHLDNSAFLEIVTSEMRARQPDATFTRAELVGRELRLFYVSPKTRRKDIYSDPRHTIVSGWSFNNCEDRGKALNAVPCLLTRFGVALEKASGASRLMHVGADLAGRTQALVARAAAREIDMDAVLARLVKLQSTPLGIVPQVEKYDASAAPWVMQLTRAGMRNDDAKAIVRNAAMVGADISPRDPLEAYSRETFSTRTAYDLVCSLLRYARNEPMRTRDRMQETAMQFLLPRARKTRKSNRP